MSRKKLKNRRRKDRAQRKILIAAVCIAAVIIGVGIGGHVIKKNAGKTMTTAKMESKKEMIISIKTPPPCRQFGESNANIIA